MYISAKVDYAMRALLTIAASEAEGAVAPTGEAVAVAAHLPVKFVENILVDLRRSGFVHAQRGAVGGYRLAREAAGITIAEVIRALEGPLAEVRGERPEDAHYDGAAANLQHIWIAVRASLRLVLESVTIADVLSGEFPGEVARLVDEPGA
ncbi:MAG: Rrf2 family transcriptional regulator, partial [Acidimicrobiales bacterium]